MLYCTKVKSVFSRAAPRTTFGQAGVLVRILTATALCLKRLLPIAVTTFPQQGKSSTQSDAANTSPTTPPSYSLKSCPGTRTYRTVRHGWTRCICDVRRASTAQNGSPTHPWASPILVELTTAPYKLSSLSHQSWQSPFPQPLNLSFGRG